jgi:hypothetical protein
MGAVPDEKQGVASAVNDTSRDLGGARTEAGGLFGAVRGPAPDSLAKAVEVAGKLGPRGGQLAAPRKTAFLTACTLLRSRWP